MPRRPSTRGFSMVEMLVALLFTGLLMAGMAQVFKTSLSTFTTSGEILSATRRNRSSIDLLYDDLNTAGMYLTDLSTPPGDVVASNPAFYVLPNMAVAGVGADGPATADQLLFYFDQPLPFEGSIGAPAGAGANQNLVLGESALTAVDNTFTIDCGNASYAGQVENGMYFVRKDSWRTYYIQTATASGKTVTAIVGPDPNAAVKGIGSGGGLGNTVPIPGSGVIFFRPGQMVRYSIQMRNLDPEQPAGIPCLIREQGNYSPAGFVVGALPQSESIITENVSGFKVYLSANAGQAWAGLGAGYSGFSSGWTSGIRADLNTQLTTAGRSGYQSTQGDENWFRNIPVVVRLDISTRSAVKRGEYSTTPTVPAYKNVTQSLVIVPRHFGLAMK